MGLRNFIKSCNDVWDAEELGEEVGHQMQKQGLEELSESTLQSIVTEHKVNLSDWVVANGFYRGMGNGYKEAEKEASDKPWWKI